MTQPIRISSVLLENFKGFAAFSLALRDLNVLVGPNNSGKSTVIGAFRVLDVAIRRARQRKPDIVSGFGRPRRGYVLQEDSISISLENVQRDYADVTSKITFRLSNDARLMLEFARPPQRYCAFFVESKGTSPSTPTEFTRVCPLVLGVVPVLGPVEHEEELVDEATVRRNLSTHRASRNFRSYWHFNRAEFDQFAQLLRQTWPGMDIQVPRVVPGPPAHLAMECLEGRMPREIYWAGFGFQIWCQLLSHVVRSRGAGCIIVDEPETYLHPDVQRRLVRVLRDVGPPIVIATHSAEILSEAEPDEIVLIDKNRRSGMRVRTLDNVQSILSALGSAQNLTLSRLARTRRVLFVEGDDFDVLSRIARRLGHGDLADSNGLTVVPIGGFGHAAELLALGRGLERTLGQRMQLAAVFDRDYHCAEEIAGLVAKFEGTFDVIHVHERKEIENYLLDPAAIGRAAVRQLEARRARGAATKPLPEEAEAMLRRITRGMKTTVGAQLVGARLDHLKGDQRTRATLVTETMNRFEEQWRDLGSRLCVVPGKEVLSKLNEELRAATAVNLTSRMIVEAMEPTDIPADLRGLLARLEAFRTRPVE